MRGRTMYTKADNNVRTALPCPNRLNRLTALILAQSTKPTIHHRFRARGVKLPLSIPVNEKLPVVFKFTPLYLYILQPNYSWEGYIRFLIGNRSGHGAVARSKSDEKSGLPLLVVELPLYSSFLFDTAQQSAPLIGSFNP